MEIINFNLLDLKEWRIVKQLRLEKIIGERHMWADLVYTRSVSPNYIKKTKKIKTHLGTFFDLKKEYPEDSFDKLVVEAVRQMYPYVMVRNADIYTDMDIKRFANIYGRQHVEQAKVYLQPDLSGFEFGKSPVGAKATLFMITLDIYVPCAEFQEYFANEGFFLSYDIANRESIKKELQEFSHTIHTLSESINK